MKKLITLLLLPIALAITTPVFAQSAAGDRTGGSRDILQVVDANTNGSTTVSARLADAQHVEFNNPSEQLKTVLLTRTSADGKSVQKIYKVLPGVTTAPLATTSSPAAN